MLWQLSYRAVVHLQGSVLGLPSACWPLQLDCAFVNGLHSNQRRANQQAE